MRTSALTLDGLSPDDATEMRRIATIHGQPGWTYAPGAHGAVVREGDRVRAFCLLREFHGGFIIDELWPDETREGVHGMKLLADWAERIVQRAATERGRALNLAGIVRLDNERHGAALKKRGYEPIAEVLSREFLPEEGTV